MERPCDAKRCMGRTGATSQVESATVMAQRPRLFPCPFCRLEFGSASLPIHIERCRARPPGASVPVASPSASRLLRPPSMVGVHDEYADNPEAVAPAHLELVPCRHCGRTFVPDRLRAHEAVCRGRPRTGETADPAKAASPTPSKWRQERDELRRSLSTARGTPAVDAAVATAKARSSSTSARRPPRREQWGMGLEGGSIERKRPPPAKAEADDAAVWIGGAATATRTALAAATVVEPRPGTAGRRMTAAQRHALEFREFEQRQQPDQVHVPSRLLRSVPSPSPHELRRAAALCPPPPPPPPPLPPQVDSAGRCLNFARTSAACGAFAASLPMSMPSPFPGDALSRAGKSHSAAWSGSVRRPASAGRRAARPLG